MFHYKHARRAENSCFIVQFISYSAMRSLMRLVKEIQSKAPAARVAVWGSD